MTATDGVLPGHALLPVAGQPLAERADAARNRRALLSAGYTIMVQRGVQALSMECVAAEAGVGIGTVYRRFGDRAGLAFALLDDGEVRFQQAFLSGPPPLGPGAPPATRIRAFLHGYIGRLATEAELHALAETRSPTARYGTGAYRTSRLHLVALLGQVGVDIDPPHLADLLLAAVGPGLFLHQHRELGYSCDHIKANLDRLLAHVLPAPADNHTR